ncbi:MAG: lipoyl(octanoyl) transferase LipB [Gammaproteobacteria bacterium]|nr:lipoyl(octanoyl) transferase LipB [Gammaproteobacteria bacterium]
MSNLSSQVIIRQLGRNAYMPVWQAMKDFTMHRNDQTKDEVWFVEHDPVFTQGQAGKAEHILFPGDIPVVQVDRGGQVTYHGPGQQVVYFLIDLKRKKLGVRELVSAIENLVVKTLAKYNIESAPRADAPGVYVGDKKICSLGLKIKKSCSFHGLALNVNMELQPFERINPCGYEGMQVTQISDYTHITQLHEIEDNLVTSLIEVLEYDQVENLVGLPDLVENSETVTGQ